MKLAKLNVNVMNILNDQIALSHYLTQYTCIVSLSKFIVLSILHHYI